MSNNFESLTTEELMAQYALHLNKKIELTDEQVKALGDELNRRGLKGIQAGKLLQTLHQAAYDHYLPFVEDHSE